jgi:hypothetical protein
LAYQPPANSNFLSGQTSHQQPVSNTFLLEQISTSHQPNEHACIVFAPVLALVVVFFHFGTPWYFNVSSDSRREEEK